MVDAKKSPTVVTVFYQGMLNTQAQAAKLVGHTGFVYHYTGERIRAGRAINTIINLRAYPEIEEVELWDLQRSVLGHVKKPITFLWFMARRASHWWNGITIEPLEGHTGTGLSMWAHAIRLRLMSLGQTRDIAEHHKRVSWCRDEHPDTQLVLYGVSRGSLTTFIAQACHRYSGVRAMVLEGCPDAIGNVIKESRGSVIHYLYKKLIHYFCEHDPEGISALASVAQFPHDVPVLFVTSEKDTVVPASCTMRLAQALAATGHQHVYCLVLKNASHEGYAYDDSHDARTYQAVVHAFYKKHAIAGYSDAWAAEGADMLEACHVDYSTNQQAHS